MTTSFAKKQRENASRWKQSTITLPDEARIAAPYVGRADSPPYPFCLPADWAAANLLPDVRQRALELFAELGIPWHAGVAGGPSNHLLSSQVQCANALTAMVDDPTRIAAAFGHTVDISEVLQIEPGRYLTFEYIGPEDHLNEARNGVRIRGAHRTSVDAAFLYRTSEGRVELALVEWKYTESYLYARKPQPAKDAERVRRYNRLYLAPDGPVRPLVPIRYMFDEPFYQLMRQQLLAHELERHHAEGAARVRVLHVLSPENLDYQRSIVRPEMKEFGDTVDEIWSFFLARRSRFRPVDPTVFLDPAVTSEEYVARYGGHRSPEQATDAEPSDESGDSVWFADETSLLQYFDLADVDALEEMIDLEVDSYVDLNRVPEGLELQMTTPNLVRTSNFLLEFPMTLDTFWEYVNDLEREVMGE
jgi:hypothetical protein